MDANEEDEYADFDLSESGGFNKTGTPTATFAHEKPPSKTGPTGQTVSLEPKICNPCRRPNHRQVSRQEFLRLKPLRLAVLLIFGLTPPLLLLSES